MTNSLARNGLIAIVTFAVLSTCDVKSTEAQGLLRRLQQRIRSRVATPAQTTPATQPRTSDPSAQRLSPVNPDSGEAAQGTSGASGTDQARRSPELGRFGGSILARPAGGQSSVRQTASKPTLGIQVLPVTEGTPGLRVAGIRDGSLAKQAGLRENDLIVAIDGKPTPNIEAIRNAMQGRRPGDRIRATVLRGETSTSVTIPLLDSAKLAASSSGTPSATQASPSASQASPSASQAGRRDSLAAADRRVRKAPVESDPVDLGVEVQTTPGKRGVVLSMVRPNSAAAAAGLSVGDRIVSIDGRRIFDVPSFQRELSQLGEGVTLSINAVRGETLNNYEVRVGDRGSENGRVANRDASSNNRPATQGATQGAAQGAGGDRPVLGGLRSVLGGFFGGSPGSDSPGGENPSDENPSGEPTGGESPSGDVAQAGGAVDPLALPDDEPIERVGFEADLAPPPRTLPADPPSVEELTPPPAQPDRESPSAKADTETKADESGTDHQDKDELIESLRDEIRRLRQRLEKLEADRSASKEA